MLTSSMDWNISMDYPHSFIHNSTLIHLLNGLNR